MRKTRKLFRPFRFFPVIEIMYLYQLVVLTIGLASPFRVPSTAGTVGAGVANIAISEEQGSDDAN
ncbi:hypothetical protein [Sphingomonas elodea]|uniref:hypothetical protein n=1 Tax=Sphingomonas elodea TaxID=179878 RepID=UPI001110BF4D|nr:hypothetical protein [Sphingomonas elodea]